MQMPRLVWGETSRERELNALYLRLQAECDRKDRRIAADREVHERAVSALRRAMEQALAERDEARRERDHHERVAFFAESESRLTIADVASSLRALLEAIETEDSPEDRPAKDSGADGAGTTPE